MTPYPAWTPASRPGIVPLHPLSFGTILGRSFVALRQNPRVLLGFALGVQTVAYLIVLLAIGGIAIASFSRLDTLREGTDDFNTVLAGSIAITAIASFVLGLLAGALSVIVQAVVVVEVTYAVVAEKRTLREIWRKVKPVIWRLLGYSALLITAVVVGVLVLTGIMVALATLSPVLAIVLSILLVLAAIPLVWWLTIKLLLIPSVIIIEGAPLGAAIARGWTLIRGRFWVSLGVIFVVSVTFGLVAQVISLPFSFLTSGLSVIIAPTGEPSVGAIVGVLVGGLLAYALLLLIQSMALVVQSTATALLYVDARMRREGLDLDLLAYVERRDTGATDLPDPYRENVGRTIAPRFAGYAPAYAGQPAPFGQPGYPQQGYAPQPYGQAPAAYAPAPPAPSAAPATPQPGAAPAAPQPTSWAPPVPPADRESPWS